MKPLYSGTLVVLTLCFLSFSASAQFSGGVYTAVQPGNWHTTSGPGIWQSAEPPQNCVNCQIVINVNGTVNLNTTVTLSNASQLVLGGAGNTTVLSIGNSGAADFADSYSVILANDGFDNKLAMANSNTIVNATGAGTYDGILTSFTSGGSTTYFKQVGNKPNGFVGNTIASNGNASDGNVLVGALNLNAQGTLPIILGNFSAVVDNGVVDLAWNTDLEINSDHFTVESSSNAGATWNTIGTVPAAGNSAIVTDYSFVDSHPAQGTTEYRLVLVDRDGRTAYSPVKAVRLGQIAAVSVYPNPASDFVNVSLSGEASVSANIRLVNLAGQVLLEKTVTNAGGTTIPLTVSSYPAGNYLIVITASDGSKQVNKILISK
ncbi:MAG TPA: T9SS type A sorting domain-containing protein [Puia sp.]|nr:T9SS type A sorting domain-containing protein [Puia sp.]